MTDTDGIALTLSNGVRVLSQQRTGYHTVTIMLRVQGGMASEPPDLLGQAYVIEQTLDKGTAQRDARALADAFDTIGSRLDISAGSQSWLLSATVLPEFVGDAVGLMAEVVSQPSFEASFVETAVELTLQELDSLEDYPKGLLRRQMSRQAFGPVMGRHSLGTPQTLARISPQSVQEHWRRACTTGGVMIAIAGCHDEQSAARRIEDAFRPLSTGSALPCDAPAEFAPARCHLDKDLEQTQIGISLPGRPYSDPQYVVEDLLLGVLDGGMGARLFTEVREKQGLVYWVSAWAERPRGLGMLHLAGATTPQRCQRTYETLLRELERVGEDITDAEVERARTGIISSSVTSGAAVSRRAAALIADMVHMGRIVPLEHKLDWYRAVTREQIVHFAQTQPRDRLSVVTVGKAESLVELA